MNTRFALLLAACLASMPTPAAAVAMPGPEDASSDQIFGIRIAQLGGLDLALPVGQVRDARGVAGLPPLRGPG
jgi:hypothetical protein